ncbi:MAG: transposase zinc-binding domain-containing protein [Deltaproteobacteria bacterium]|nr:transposase zinc-binding domain-containing protein [Deltaproteobacteria bacterium]
MPTPRAAAYLATSSASSLLTSSAASSRTGSRACAVRTCDDEIVVAFSCKRRGICPSCTARRMADTAAHLVDRVLPRAPFRQWVFTVPKPLRLVLGREPAWTSWVGGLVVRAIGAWQRRFGGLVNLNVHYHLVVPDGVFVKSDEGLRFEMLPPDQRQRAGDHRRMQARRYAAPRGCVHGARASRCTRVS